MPDYVIKITAKAPAADAKPTVTERLVRAKNEAAAVKQVVADTISVERATGDDYMRLAKLGIEIENAF